MYDFTMTSFLCFHQRKRLKSKNVIIKANYKFMSVFELSGPNVVSIPNFSSISLQMATFQYLCDPETIIDLFLLLLSFFSIQ